MGLSITTLALAKKYTNDSLVGLGAVKGSPCTIKTIEKQADGNNKVTFEWTSSNGIVQNSVMYVQDGKSITSIDINADNRFIVTLSDGSSYTTNAVKTIKGDTGPKGDPGPRGAAGPQGEKGFSPTIVENNNNSQTVYKLDIVNENHTFTTPNLLGNSANIDLTKIVTDIDIQGTNLIVTKGDGTTKILKLPSVKPEEEKEFIALSASMNPNGEVEIQFEGEPKEMMPSLFCKYETGELCVDNNGNNNIVFNVNNKNLEVEL